MNLRTETVIANARIVTPEAVIDGGAVVLDRDGRIAAVDPDGSRAPGAVDLDGDYLVPGLVELHTDNLEKHFAPRPGVRWPGLAATVGHDWQVVTAGITTVYDAITVGETVLGGDRLANLQAMVDSVATAWARGMLRSEHRLHLRCEVSHASTVQLFERLVEEPLVELVSLMDHTPGQRQFTSFETYRRYYLKKFHFTDEEFAIFVERQAAAHKLHSGPNRATIVAQAKARGYTLASHDDATPEHVEEAAAAGMRIAEFPTTVEAAELSRRHGMQILMGAPNVVRGGSHSGNVSALDLARRGLLDILSSDYVPGSLIQSAFQLAATIEQITLPQAVAMVTRNPARAVGLDDRGEIAAGRRADLVRIREIDGLPLVQAVWRGGERII
ncbi:MAG TPA: alpha-D-ribose 1-methylphosphonate 5-triphosphate diphosphatase [Stellaceae bacterium]